MLIDICVNKNFTYEKTCRQEFCLQYIHAYGFIAPTNIFAYEFRLPTRFVCLRVFYLRSYPPTKPLPTSLGRIVFNITYKYMYF